ncbi:Vesicle trafficking protein Sly1 (Sec1 family) [Scheffersomyces stipitis CBS 6054]|uniref:Vesicle trafficking protein Sly1 (Sec1 family) n=1 Tax=Scheffersomyces stipitis (strain ATCC 58785 / CBS 6054 / NBRC 10063 / NRRL Y-11545) TaxID=322104 RepID=A3GEZ0_PICST|nr:Vesicle trafficking protein Sly1 (Sec1 family) [Scheffersomyces stipitis CBS 6054]EAZ63254.2 Vesicle trafficking protein Sly1 (Sec1 family) [Scheffersomyces stipitis CBS 6054]
MSLVDTSSLRGRQIATLERMLHLNKDGSPDLTLASKNEDIIWKVLVLDTKSRAVLSSVLRVNDLLRCGITVHSLISQKRTALPDVPVIYFVEPNIDNVLQIIDDLESDKYDKFYVNFTSSINRELLEEFAKKVSISGRSFRIKQVYDQYLDFIVTEPNLFSLDFKDIFTQFNNAGTDEDTIHRLVDQIASGLLSTIITQENVPVIRAQQGGPAEFVATQLDLKLRDYLSNSRSSSSSAQSIQQRPVLILLDRNIDLASMLAHSWIYQCMVSDVFSLQRNTIRIHKYKENESTPEFKNYDVDPRDFFWNKYSQLPFPDVVESADIELNAYKTEAKELTNKTGITSLTDIDPNSNDTANMQQALEKLPELTARKTTLDMHMDILAALINELQAKSLDKFFEIEQNASDPKIESEFLELLTSSAQRDNAQDKLRTFLILVLLVDLPKQYITKVRNVFVDKYPTINLASLDYVLKFKEHAKLTNISSLNDTSTQNSYSNSANNNTNTSALLSGLSSKLYGLTEGKISEGLTSIASKIKNFIPEKKQLPITSVVEAIMDPNNASNTSTQLTDDYLYLDPKSRGGHSKPPRRQSYQESLVFVIGGGNYLEYQNLQEWASQPNKPNKKVVYGSTSISSASEFLDECIELGSR